MSQSELLLCKNLVSKSVALSYERRATVPGWFLEHLICDSQTQGAEVLRDFLQDYILTEISQSQE